MPPERPRRRHKQPCMCVIKQSLTFHGGVLLLVLSEGCANVHRQRSASEVFVSSRDSCRDSVDELESHDLLHAPCNALVDTNLPANYRVCCSTLGRIRLLRFCGDNPPLPTPSSLVARHFVLQDAVTRRLTLDSRDLAKLLISNLSHGFEWPIKMAVLLARHGVVHKPLQGPLKSKDLYRLDQGLDSLSILPTLGQQNHHAAVVHRSASVQIPPR